MHGPYISSGAVYGYHLKYATLYRHAQLQTRPTSGKSLVSPESSRVIACSMMKKKRAYCSDLETIGEYCTPKNLIMKAVQIILDPCAKVLQEIMNHIQDIEEKESRGIVTTEEITFEGEWSKRQKATEQAILSNGIKVFSIDMIRKMYDYASVALFSTRIADRLTKRVEYSAERKLMRIAAHKNWISGRIDVMGQLYKTCAYSFILGRLATFTQEIISTNIELWRVMGTKGYFKPSKKRTRRMMSWTLRRASYYTCQWGCYVVFASYWSSFDYGWAGKNWGFHIGITLAELATDAIAGVFDGFVTTKDVDSVDTWAGAGVGTGAGAGAGKGASWQLNDVDCE